MKVIITSLYLNILLISFANSASTENVSVLDGYIRGLPPSVTNTSAYMRILNSSNEDLVLTGGTSEFAESVSLHRSETQNSIISMSPVSSVSVPGNGELLLQSGSLHFMFMGLKAPLNNDEEVKLTLIFQGGIEKSISLPVRNVLAESRQD